MQAVFTNIVAKVMAKNESTIEIKAGALNTVTSGVSSATGDANYILNSTIKNENKEGIITLQVGSKIFGNINTIKKEDETLCMTEEEYQDLLKKSQELISKSQELELAKKEIEELKNIKEIPDGYLKPSGTIKITDVLNNIDVSSYQFADTSTLFKQSDLKYQILEQIFPSNYTSMIIDFGYIPQFICIVGSNKFGDLAVYYSYDYCNTFYAAHGQEKLGVTESVYKENGKIKWVSKSGNYNGRTLKIYAIK